MTAKKPRWTQDDALRRGQTATRLAVKHATVLDPYLSPGARDQLLAARATLGDESAIRALGTQKTATAAKRGNAKQIHDVIMRIRNAVARTHGVTLEQRAAVGIGETLSETDVDAILAQVGSIHANRDLLAGCGIIAPVVDALVAGSTTLRATKDAQASAHDARSDTTDGRLDAHLTIERLVDEISSRGELAFEVAGDAVVSDRFARLVSENGPSAEDVTEAGSDDTPPPATPPTPSPATPVAT